MNLIERWFSPPIPSAKETLPLWHPDHPARSRIAEATALADAGFRTGPAGIAGAAVAIRVSGAAEDCRRALERALDLAPNDPDLLAATADAHDALGDVETGRAVRRRALSLLPDHFDAGMRHRHPRRWPNLFTFPGWSERSAELPHGLRGHESGRLVIGIVRDALCLSPLLLLGLPEGARPLHAAGWDPDWIDTPHAPVFRIRIVLRGQTGAAHATDRLLSPYPLDRVGPCEPNWLIHRFCHARAVFVVLTAGDSVVFNRRIVVSASQRRGLAVVRRRLACLDLPADHDERQRRARAWIGERSRLVRLPA